MANRKEDGYMGVLAIPNKNAYVVKKECADQIVNHKTPQKTLENIQKSAELFRKNNLKTGK